MKNNKLANKLFKKWEAPNQRPSKGSAFDLKCNPCAQSEAVMEALGVGHLDLKALIANNPSLPYLDKTAAKVLGISETHATLLRVVNDYAEVNPGVVLKNVQAVLGSKWREVLRFWRYLDNLSMEEWENIKDSLKSVFSPAENWEAQKESLRAVVEKLNTDVKTSFEDLVDRRYKRLAILKKKSLNLNYCGLASWECCVRNGVSYGKVVELSEYEYARITVPYLVAYAACEIQCLDNYSSFQDLYFCKILGYNPFAPAILTFSSSFAKEFRNIISAKWGQIYTTVDNFVFNRRFSHLFEKVDLGGPDLNGSSNGILGSISLSIKDLESPNLYSNLMERVKELTKNLEGPLPWGLFIDLKVPILGKGTEAERNFNELLDKTGSFRIVPSDQVNDDGGTAWKVELYP